MRATCGDGSLALSYLLATFLSLTTLICTIVSWTHWWEILENCEESGVYCGCILYGSETFNYFTGGKNVFCHFVVYASLPVLAAALFFAGYHGYRSCIATKRRKEKDRPPIVRARRRSGDVIALTTLRSDEPAWAGGDPSCVCWIPMAILATLLAALLFSQAVVLSDGYRTTCREYRKHLVKTVPATGIMANAFYDRVECSAILDFMDYLEPYRRSFRPDKDRDSRYPFQEQLDRTRGGRINTAMALQFAMGSTWLNWIVFVAIVVQNAVIARASRLGMRCCC